ncbi:MAG: hypothetical protein IPI67_26635 [Myxococcales bacterium]|nr:hypothetical protein [Myxococcales bacterium]
MRTGEDHVDFVLRNGAFSAKFRAEPTDLSATVQGSYGVRCWVPPEALGEPQNGYGMMPDGQPMKQLVLDTAKQSDFCQNFR